MYSADNCKFMENSISNVERQSKMRQNFAINYKKYPTFILIFLAILYKDTSTVSCSSKLHLNNKWQ